MDYAADMNDELPLPSDIPADGAAAEEPEQKESDRKLVQRIIQTIRADKRHHDKAFKVMKRDMFVAKHGRTPDWPEGNYTANIAGRHVKQKTDALYAKNPKAVARRRETLDFTIWDGSVESLELAMRTVQQAAQVEAAAAAAPPAIDPVTQLPVPVQPQLPPGFAEAQALIADFQQGMERRKLIGKLGKTLEILFAYYLREQKPLDFKMGMKKLVRRACTTGVGYLELGFQREYGPRPDTEARLTDARTRLDHLRRLAEEVGEGEILEDDAEMAELERSIEKLQAEPEVVIREGLIIDFPASTKVIPDSLCKSLVGFVGARHLSIEYLFTVDEVKEMFGVDLGKNYKGYSADGKTTEAPEQSDLFVDDENNPTISTQKGNGLVCVWKHYDKPSGLVYYVADGYPSFLREPAAPDVFVDDFWPVYALTFNDVESEDELFPPSDVTLMLGMQGELNRSRQGKREHRQAARPRWGYSNGAIEDEDVEKLKSMKPFEAVGFNKDPQTKLADVLEVLPVPGVDPNLYDTNEIMSDMQVVVGTQEALMGGLAKATATESAISANASASASGSGVDDLDAFLSLVARAGGQILLREMSEEQVKTIAGPGAVWPHLTLAEIADELYLEVEAGSTGKPNQAVEIHNWQQMLPNLMQMPSISPTWLAKETLRRLDDRMDLSDAIASGIPSIVAQNQMQQPGAGPTDPAAQGAEGANNAPQPQEQAGSDPAFGSNQV